MLQLHTHFARFQPDGKKNSEEAAYFGVTEIQKDRNNGHIHYILSTSCRHTDDMQRIACHKLT